ncbi:MAG TPA: STAS domain-containing protein [bacterium]|nr:STAS domain-containing protein [bacterium]
MDVAVRTTDDICVFTLRGTALGGPECDLLRAELDRALARGSRKLLVDLTAVPWMNSAGLGIFLSAYSRLRGLGGELRFCGVGTRVYEILRTTKLLTVLAVLDDEETGIRSFREASAHPGEGAGADRD